LLKIQKGLRCSSLHLIGNTPKCIPKKPIAKCNSNFNPEVFMKKSSRTWASLLVAVSFCASGIQAHAKEVDEKVKDFIDQTAETLKNGIEKLGDDFAKIQDHLEKYPWKGLIQNQATSGPETLSHLKLNHRDKVVVVRPGEVVQGQVVCSLSEDASLLNVYRVVIGLQDQGPQTTIGTTVGALKGSSIEEFSLTAPTKPGIYQIRFRTANNFLEGKALDHWFDEKGNEPDASTTIGIIYVKS